LVNNMEILKEVGLLFSGIRGLMYLDAFIKNETVPNVVIVQTDLSNDFYAKYPVDFWKRYVNYFNFDKRLDYYLSKFSIDSIRLKSPDINSAEFEDVIDRRFEKFFVFSGGGIVKGSLFKKGKKFIHLHPGILPNYRGSTCYYYSMLTENNCGVSAFFMNEKIDAGNIIDKHMVRIPSVDEEDWFFFDLIFDPWIRAELLKNILARYKQTETFDSTPQDFMKGNSYFVIHPVLKNLAIRKNIKNNN